MIAKYQDKFYDVIDTGDGFSLISDKPHKDFKAGEGYYYHNMTLKDIEETTFKSGQMPVKVPTEKQKRDFEKDLNYVNECLKVVGPEYLDKIFE